MSDFSFYGPDNSPTIIIGKFALDRINPTVLSAYQGSNALNTLGGYQANDYELWFNSTISFIPHGRSPVFVADVQGNITHDGNLLTKQNLTVNGTTTVIGSATFRGPVTIENDVTITENLQVTKDVRIDGDLYVNGQIFSTYLNNLLASADDDLRVKGDLYVEGDIFSEYLDNLLTPDEPETDESETEEE